MTKINKRLMFAFAVVLLVACVSPAQAQQDDDHAKPKPSDSAPTFTIYTATGNYHQGDIVLRDYKTYGGSAGPFFSLTGHNGKIDPALDTVDWYYCCGVPTGPTVFPKGVINGSATSILVPVTTNGQMGECVPLSGPVTGPASTDPTNACMAGGVGTNTVALPVGPYAFVIDVSPKIPDDGSVMEVFFVDENGSDLSNQCYLNTAQSECTVVNPNFYLSTPWSVGDTQFLGFGWQPGTNNLPSFTLTSAHWSIIALP